LADKRLARNIITRRGFVDWLVLSADRFTDNADLIFAHAPLLRELHITAGGGWRAFFTTLLRSSVCSLSFADGVFTVEAANELAAGACGRALVMLELENQPLGPDGMTALASAALWNVQKLSVSNCRIGDEGVRELFSGETFKSLRELDLSDNDLTSYACRVLAQASDLDRLERLALCDNRITAHGVAALATAPHLGRLRELNLYSNPIGPEGGRAILASRHWGGLEHLSLTNCGVGVTVVEDLRWVYGQKAVTA
jgi:Ran GTPase-activating protein (RanGAP) involved in mRNA processing and transport